MKCWFNPAEDAVAFAKALDTISIILVAVDKPDFPRATRFEQQVRGEGPVSTILPLSMSCKSCYHHKRRESALVSSIILSFAGLTLLFVSGILAAITFFLSDRTAPYVNGETYIPKSI